MREPDEIPTGQEMNGVEYDDPAYTIIFIIVQWNSQDFSFINKVENRFGFKWERWSKWKHLLRPFSCHAFLCASYNTKTSNSGQGFKPIEHVMEFSGINEARVFNAWYLEQYRRWNDDASAEFASAETLSFVQKMIDFDDVRKEYAKIVASGARDFFADDEYIRKLEFALWVSKQPMPEFIIDGPDAEWLLHGDFVE